MHHKIKISDIILECVLSQRSDSSSCKWMFPNVETSEECWKAWWALHDCFEKEDLIEMLLVPPKETDPKETVGEF